MALSLRMKKEPQDLDVSTFNCSKIPFQWIIRTFSKKTGNADSIVLLDAFW